MELLLSGWDLTLPDLVVVAEGRARLRFSEEAATRVQQSRALVDRFVAERRVVYGLTTGCGPLCNRFIPPEQMEEFQRNLVRSHCTGVGERLATPLVRATMAVRANSLAAGYSGLRLSTLQTLLDLLNHGIHPVIPESGSVGASGDLVHLAHTARALMGEGKVEYQGRLMEAMEAFRAEGLKPVILSYKEGLALINGTSCMTGIAALAVFGAERLNQVADLTAALGMEALRGSVEAFDPDLQQVRPHPGQVRTARNIRRLVEGSGLIRHGTELLSGLQQQYTQTQEYLPANEDLQDPYTLRCTPQILGAARDAVAYVRQGVETEMNSVTDNPLIFADTGRALHGGNFHGQSIALAMDVLKIALTEVGILSERRLARLLDEKLNRGLPPFLIMGQPGTQSGFMGIQYTASSLVAENRVLVTPASVQTVSTNAHNQDVVSMGTVAARQAYQILGNVEQMLAIELLCAAQALDLRGPEQAGRGTRAVHQTLRQMIPPLTEDAALDATIAQVVDLIRRNVLVEAAQSQVSEWE